MPKLLDKIKEMGLSHEDVIKLIEKSKDIKPNDKKDKKDKKDVPDTKDEQIDKPDQETETSKEELDKKTKALVKKLADEEEAKIKAEEKDEKTKIIKLVQEELKKRGKITRRTPSKGKIVKTPSLDYDINVKGYEVKTIRIKKD